MENILDKTAHLPQAPIDNSLIENFGHEVTQDGECFVLHYFIRFIYKAFFEIARSDENATYNARFNRHKKKHYLRFQIATLLSRIPLDAFTLLDNRRCE